MAYTLGEAAKATGKSKPTISRAIKNGTVSASRNDDGSYSIEPVELHRVFPMIGGTSNDTGTKETHETPNDRRALQVEIDLLRERLAERDQHTAERLAEKDAQIADLRSDRDSWRQQATALLSDQRPETLAEPPPEPWFKLGPLRIGGRRKEASKT